MKTRVLIIPHQPHRDAKVRTVEMAKYLASHNRYQVYLLTWQASSRRWDNLPERMLNKMLELRRTISTPVRITKEEGGIRWVTLPYLLAPYPFCQQFNQQQVAHFVRKHGIQAIISGNGYHFPTPKHPNLYRIYDVADDHFSPDSGPLWQRTRQFAMNELKHAHQRIAVSQAMQSELHRLGFEETTLIPTGIDLAAHKTVRPASVEAIREQYALHDQFTIGYFGSQEHWLDPDLLLQTFQQLQSKVPDSRLLIVGGVEEFGQHKSSVEENPNILHTGVIPAREAAPYFQAVDIGVLPFHHCSATEKILPLKILEFGAAQKKVLSTPLQELITLQLPHVSLLEADPAQWAEALVQAAISPAPWQPEWDAVIGAYDWPVILQELEILLEEGLDPHCHESAV
jgi:glycosyltransferase involved in cell wall biosynthesis